MTDITPWAHVAVKGTHFGGVISADLSDGGKAPVSAKEAKSWKREVAKFCGGFIADGYEIKTVYSRDEYTAILDATDMGERLRQQSAETSAAGR